MLVLRNDFSIVKLFEYQVNTSLQQQIFVRNMVV